MSKPKEPAYYAADLAIHGRIADRHRYLELFEQGRSLRYRGEATPWYLYSAVAAEEIRRDVSQARIVVSLRNPVDMLVSLHRHHVYRGIESEPDFERAIREPRAPSFDDFRNSLDYLDVARLGEQAARFADVFSDREIHFVRFDELAARPEPAFHSLLEFLELPVISLDEYTAFNVGRRRRSRRLDAATERLVKGDAPSRWRRALRYRVSTFNTVVSKGSISEELRSELIERLAPQIQMLEKLSGEDLSMWRQVPPNVE